MTRNTRVFSTLGALALVLFAAPTYGWQVPDVGQRTIGPRKPAAKPTVRVRRPRQAARVHRGPTESRPEPDVLVLANGERLQVYFLSIRGEYLTFFLPQNDRTWEKHEVPRRQVKNILFGQYLEKDPLLPRHVGRAEKQPVPKSETLAGTYHGRQGRYTKWKFTFKSEINKPYSYTEDASEFGTFIVESTLTQTVNGRRHKSIGRAQGRYYLYPPNTINNKEWVLFVDKAVHTEITENGSKSWLTTPLHETAFIVDFSPMKDSFRLHWSTVGAWNWTTITQVQFHRNGAKRTRLRRALRDSEPFQTGVSGEVILAAVDDPAAWVAAVGTDTRDSSPALARRTITANATPRKGRWDFDHWRRPRFRLP